MATRVTETGQATRELNMPGGIRLHLMAPCISGPEPARCAGCRLDVKINHVNDTWVELRATVTNNGTAPVGIDWIAPLRVSEIATSKALDLVYSQGRDMCGFSRLEALTGELDSNALAGWTAADGTAALLIGFADFKHAFGSIHVAGEHGAYSLVEARWLREGLALQPGATLDCAPVLIGAGESLSNLLTDYARQVGESMEARTAAAPMTGWCSWYYYYGTETQEDVLNDVAALAASSVGQHLKVIQLDDGWNLPSPEHPRVWGDWEPGIKFPRGMRAVVDEIHGHGFQAGLWLAPFSVDKASRLFAAHPEWLVAGEITNTGLVEPADCWGVAGLDLTHPEAQSFLRRTFERVFDEWGFDYIKIDFLQHAMVSGKRHDNSLTTAEIYRLGLSIIREVAGNRFVLTCGAPLETSIGLADAMRIGMDVSSRWYLPFNLGSWPLGNCSVVSGAHQVWMRQWMHQAYWQNDPDCLIVRDFASPGELHEFARLSNGDFLGEPRFGLSADEAGFWLRLIWLTGGMTMLGECVQHLSVERMELLQQAFPPIAQPARWLDWYAEPGLRLLWSDAELGMLGVFNFTDEPKQLRLPAAKINAQEAICLEERFDGTLLKMSGEVLIFPPLPAHAGRVWRVSRS